MQRPPDRLSYLQARRLKRVVQQEFDLVLGRLVETMLDGGRRGAVVRLVAFNCRPGNSDDPVELFRYQVGKIPDHKLLRYDFGLATQT